MACCFQESGHWVKVLAVGVREPGEWVYNFEIANTHTYFVGQQGVLVHNTNPTNPCADPLPEILPEGYTPSPALSGDPYNPALVKGRSLERKWWKNESGYHGRKPTYENPGHHDPTSPNYRGGGSLTTTLSPDAADAYKKAIPTSEYTWYGQNAQGEIYRFQGNMELFIGMVERTHHVGFLYLLRFVVDWKGGHIKMLFGSREIFGVECEQDASFIHPNCVFGQICLWAENRPIGDYQVTVMLDVPVNHFQGTLQFEGQRRDPVLDGQQKETVLETVYEVLWKNSQKFYPTYNQFEHRFKKFFICPGGGEAFDGFVCLLLDQDNGERLIWKCLGINPQFGELNQTTIIESQTTKSLDSKSSIELPTIQIEPLVEKSIVYEVTLPISEYERVIGLFLDWFQGFRK